MTTPPPEQCGAPGVAGPCVLPLGHDESLHEGLDGKCWLIDVDGEPTRVQGAREMPPEVRDALEDVIRTVQRNHGRPALREQLVRLRQQHGISQAELAQRIGVTQTAVSYWETGQRQPGLDDVERWAAALGATPNLFQGSPTAGSNALRDQLAEVLTREHYRRAREHIEASVEDHCAGFADAVLPVVEAETAAKDAEIERLGSEWVAAHNRATRNRQRAEEAEATVRRSREALAAFDGRGINNFDVPTPAEILEAWRASFDQPKETP